MRGWLYLAKGAPLLAIDDFDIVIERDPERGNAYLFRGLARARLGDETALNDAEKGLQKLSQKSDRAYYVAACVYAVFAEPLKGADRIQFASRALELLEEALSAAKEGRAKFYDEVLMKDPDWNWLRNDLKFPRREKL